MIRNSLESVGIRWNLLEKATLQFVVYIKVEH